VGFMIKTRAEEKSHVLLVRELVLRVAFEL
jgi:hypothetical protein